MLNASSHAGIMSAGHFVVYTQSDKGGKLESCFNSLKMYLFIENCLVHRLADSQSIKAGLLTVCLLSHLFLVMWVKTITLCLTRSELFSNQMSLWFSSGRLGCGEGSEQEGNINVCYTILAQTFKSHFGCPYCFGFMHLHRYISGIWQSSALSLLSDAHKDHTCL